MSITPLRAAKPGDWERADALAAVTRKAILPFRDYRKAIQAGYILQYPDLAQTHYHFVNPLIGRRSLDPARPQFLLYEKTSGREAREPSFKLVGVMYQTSIAVSDADLDRWVPLSIAQWHTHDNMCLPPPESKANWIAGDPTFGMNGSIQTEAACRALGGAFSPHLGGWMTHLYPFERNPARRWVTDMDHDRMDSMPMK